MDLSLLLKVALVALAVSSSAAPTGYVFYNGALSPDNWVYEGGKATNWQNGGVHGAPGPIAGAGTPGSSHWLRRLLAGPAAPQGSVRVQNSTKKAASWGGPLFWGRSGPAEGPCVCVVKTFHHIVVGSDDERARKVLAARYKLAIVPADPRGVA